MARSSICWNLGGDHGSLTLSIKKKKKKKKTLLVQQVKEHEGRVG